MVTRGVDQPLVALSVVGDETGDPADRFLILIGVPYSGMGTGRRTAAGPR